MKKKTALVLGASGMVGRELVKVLAGQNTYEKIHLLVRRPIEPVAPLCEVHAVDFDRLESYPELFQVTDVFCCLGTTIKKAKTKQAFRKVDFQYPLEAAKMAAKQGAEKFLIITAMGANPKSMFFYNQVKGDIEAALKELNLPSLHIFRPSLLLGDRGEQRLGEEIAAKFSGVLNALMIGPLTPYRAIEAKNVAKAMAASAQSSNTGINIYPSHEIEKMAVRNL
ncbi:oxidoreductase [Neobacillus niacini]|uniref:oxidoreductase n=1 Tax=Neobacillus niacini TaxID=86668 RepID=UPI0021CB5098|nr:oxidoreductase [Neobacillus niacini]MCM3764709.1 oxidoreductase [Neobacillus niacini]